MILADTSVWIGHLAKFNDVMARLLQEKKIILHPHVIGEIALGNLKNREPVLASLIKFKALAVASESDVLALIELNGLSGSGIGYVDCHLLASAAIGNTRLWTFDRRLTAAAQKMNLAI